MKEWFRLYYLWLQNGPDWHITEYGQRGVTKGDGLYNTLTRIREQDDHSDWANDSISECAWLLKNGIRWPNILSDSNDAKNRIDEYWSKLLHKLKIRNFHKYRPQKSVTRDPWIALYAVAVDRDRRELLLNKPPWWLRTPTFAAWRKLLIKPNKWSLFIFRLGMKLTFCNKQYVIRLRELMEGAIMIIVNDRVNKLIN